jgi:hypothetical protein
VDCTVVLGLQSQCTHWGGREECSHDGAAAVAFTVVWLPYYEHSHSYLSPPSLALPTAQCGHVMSPQALPHLPCLQAGCVHACGA